MRSFQVGPRTQSIPEFAEEWGSRYHRNGSVKVYSGGWHTVTTKDRINTYSPASVTQRDYAWYLNGEPFTEGAEVGTPSRQPVSLFN